MTFVTHDPSVPVTRLVRHTILLGAASGATIVLGFAVFAYLSRRLGAAAYGDYSVAFILFMWCTDLLGVITGGATAHVVASRADGDQFACTMLWITVLVGILLSAVVIAAAPFVAGCFGDPAIRLPLSCFAAGIPAAGASHVLSMAAAGRGKHAFLPLIQIASFACRLAGSVILVECGAGAAGAAAAVSIAEVFRCVVAQRVSGIRVLSTPTLPLAEVFGRSRLIIGNGLVSRALFSMDLLAVKFLAPGPEAAGLYAAAQNLCLLPWIGFAGSAGVVAHAIAARPSTGDGATIRSLADGYMRFALLAAGLVLAVMPLAPAVTTMLLGDRYFAAGPVAMMLLAATALRMVAISGQAVTAGLGESPVYTLGLAALAGVGIAVFAYRAPQISSSFAARGFEPMVGYAFVTTALALATAIGSLGAGTVMSGTSFPWLTLGRVIPAAMLAASIGWLVPDTGFWVLPRLALVTTVFLTTVTLLGEWRLMRGALAALALRRVPERDTHQEIAESIP